VHRNAFFIYVLIVVLWEKNTLKQMCLRYDDGQDLIHTLVFGVSHR
jgi:hypothetical protein